MTAPGRNAPVVTATARTVEEGRQIAEACVGMGLHYVIQFEPQTPEEADSVARTFGGARPPEPRPGRNAPCPCGSGSKFKRCCGRGGNAAPG